VRIADSFSIEKNGVRCFLGHDERLVPCMVVKWRVRRLSDGLERGRGIAKEKLWRISLGWIKIGVHKNGILFRLEDLKCER
jgi:hypothetical protein